jgi:hypothetical protein
LITRHRTKTNKIINTTQKIKRWAIQTSATKPGVNPGACEG